MKRIRSSKPDESELVKFDHAYKCSHCKKIWLGLELEKKNGKRFCRNCVLFEVEDITFTEEGANYLVWLGKIDNPF